MKGPLFIIGVLATALAIHTFIPNSNIKTNEAASQLNNFLHQATGSPAVQQVGHRLQTDLNTFLNQMGIQVATPQDLNQQIDQVIQNLNEVDQQLMDQALAHHLKIKRLPNPPETEHQNAPGQNVSHIQIDAGDQSVSQTALQSAVQIVQNISLPILKSTVWQPTQSSHIVLFSTKNSYGNSLLQAGVPQDQLRSIVSQTGGLTVGSDIWIPLYNLHSKGDLANTLTHELTHVSLNQRGIGDIVPTWVNEGIAWNSGMQALSQVDPYKAKQMESAYNRQIEEVSQRGQLLPLTVDEQGILQAKYNVEWEDYLAVKNLIQQDGIDKFREFLSGSGKTGVNNSFHTQYQLPISQYEDQFYRSL